MPAAERQQETGRHGWPLRRPSRKSLHHQPSTSGTESICANPAAGPAESITLCDSRCGTGVWPEFRERPRSARTSAPLTAGHLGTARNAAGLLPIRTALAAGSPPPAAVGPARARRRTCAGKGPVSGCGGPGHWRPSGRRRPGWAYRGKAVSRGRAAPQVPVPIRGAPPPWAAGWSSTSSRSWPS